MATAIVADGCANILGNFFNVAAEVFDALLRKVFAFERRIEVGYVGVMVFVVMDLHRLGVDVRFQCIVRIWQRGKCVSHGGISWSVSGIDTRKITLGGCFDNEPKRRCDRWAEERKYLRTRLASEPAKW